MSFKNIKHQPQVISFLEKIFEKSRLPHALLFAGPSTPDKRQAAMAMAKVLFCGDKKGLEPCEACIHCRQLEKNSHPDFMVLEPEEETSVIKIEAVRTLIAKTHLKPFQANAKVFVIDRAECMNEAAQNALLKTLEEPEQNNLLILISSAAETLLPTIRSRTQVLNFMPAPALEPSEEDGNDEKKAMLDFISGKKEFGPLPSGAGMEREELTRILEEGILGLRRELRKKKLKGSFFEDEMIERIETLAAFKEKIAESANVKLALAVLWQELRKPAAAHD